MSRSYPGEEMGEQHLLKERPTYKLKVSYGWSTEFNGNGRSKTRGKQKLDCKQFQGVKTLAMNNQKLLKSELKSLNEYESLGLHFRKIKGFE